MNRSLIIIFSFAIRPDGSQGFLYSYTFYETARKGGGWQTFCLVGYKRESKQDGG